jgi:rhodanese-related sulfurtransferase
MQTISVVELNKLVKEGKSITLIDVRTPVEYREVHAYCAKNIPLHDLNTQSLQNQIGNQGETLYLICHKGNRSQSACKLLMDSGVTNVVTVEGGTEAWEQAGLDVIRGKKAISIERQVRIAAGFLVLVGAGLGFFVHPYFIGISAFVGAGLMFAGITDTCGMAMMLAKMPWNK